VSAIKHLCAHIPSRPAAGIAETAILRLAELSEFGEDAKWSVMLSTGLSLLSFQRKGCGFVCVFSCHVSGKFWVIGKEVKAYGRRIKKSDNKRGICNGSSLHC
jgi:hypothetical protein